MANEPSYTFEQIERGTEILRDYGAAVLESDREGGQIYELDYLRRIAEVFTPGRVMR